jgi:hypothetical protein
MLRWGRFFSLITGFLNRVIALLLGAFVLVLMVRPEFFVKADAEGGRSLPVDFLLEHKTAIALAAILYLLLNLNVIQMLLYSLWNTDVRRYITSKSEHGTTRVSLDAVERSLVMATREIPEIEKTKLRVYRIGAKRYKVEVRFWIPAGCNALNINEKLRLVLKKRFAELVSMEPDERVFFEINLAGFKGQMSKVTYSPGGPPRDAIDTSKDQFKGPIYPVEGEI